MTTTSDDPLDATEPQAPASVRPQMASKRLVVAWLVAAVLAILALLSSAMLWQKLSRIQEQLARQSADTGLQALEAKTWAKQALETVQDSAARVSLMEARVSEVALQRSQLEELMQSLSRTRDENLVGDIQSALRIAQQQAHMLGSTEPLVEALQTAQKRVERAAQPRLLPVSRAFEKDLERLSSLPAFDLPSLLARLDEGVTMVDGLSLANDMLASQSQRRQQEEFSSESLPLPWWQVGLNRIGDEIKSLFRVSRIDVPEAALLSPEQAFFVRENLKLKLLNARLGLLARQKDKVRTDLNSAAVLVRRYAEPQSRRTILLLQLLEQTSDQVRSSEVPRIDGSLAALSTAEQGR